MTSRRLSAAVEREIKLVLATFVSLAVGVAVTLLNDLQADSSLLGGLPAWLQTVITIVVPPLATWLAGWRRRHPAPIPVSAERRS